MTPSENIAVHIKETIIVIIVASAIVYLLTLVHGCTRKLNDDQHEMKMNEIKLEQSKIDLQMEKVKTGYKVITTEGVEK